MIKEVLKLKEPVKFKAKIIAYIIITRVFEVSSKTGFMRDFQLNICDRVKNDLITELRKRSNENE